MFRTGSQGSATHSMGVYWKGFGPAFSTQMKLWSIREEQFVPAEARLYVHDSDMLKCRLFWGSSKLILGLLLLWAMRFGNK